MSFYQPKSPPKLFESGDWVLVTYEGETYRGQVIGPALYPAGTYRVKRWSKRQPPEGWGLEDYRVETVDPMFMVKVVNP